jgi:histone H3/H4
MLPQLPFERICKSLDARLSGEALKEIREFIEERANYITEEAVRLAHHANRKTVTKKDIEFVLQRRMI